MSKQTQTSPIHFSQSSEDVKRKKLEKLQCQDPDKIPVVFSPLNKTEKSDFKEIKILSSKKNKLSTLLTTLRGQLNIRPERSLLIMSRDGKTLSINDTISDLFLRYQSDDGFLYLRYGELECLG